MKTIHALGLILCLLSALSVDAAQRSDEHQPPTLSHAMLEDEEQPEMFEQPMIGSLIHAAAANDHAVVIELLHRIGADVNARDEDGLMPIHHAIMNDAVAAVRALVIAGADLLAPTRAGMSPLFLTTQNEGLQVLHYVLDAQGDAALLHRNQDGDSALHAAVRGRNPGAIILLLVRGMPVEVINHFGRAAIHAAVLAQNVEAIRILRVFGARAYHADHGGRTALDLARVTRNQAVIAALTQELDPVTVLAPYAVLIALNAPHTGRLSMTIEQVIPKRHRDDDHDNGDNDSGKFLRVATAPSSGPGLWAAPSHLN